MDSPVSSHVMSQTQVAEVIDKNEILTRRFLGGKQLEALPGNDFKSGNFNIAPGANETGDSSVSPTPAQDSPLRDSHRLESVRHASR